MFLKIIIVIVLFILLVNNIIKGVHLHILKKIVYTENIKFREKFKKQAIKILLKTLNDNEEFDAFVYYEVLFKINIYEDYYIKNGFIKTIEFLNNNISDSNYLKEKYEYINNIILQLNSNKDE